MKKGYVIIDGWIYDRPDLSSDKEGNIVLFSKKCLGPLEIFEWGLDQDQNPYERYAWLEDDYFEDLNYCRTITKEELLKQIAIAVALFEENGLSEWVHLYEGMIDRLNSDSYQELKTESEKLD